MTTPDRPRPDRVEGERPDPAAAQRPDLASGERPELVEGLGPARPLGRERPEPVEGLRRAQPAAAPAPGPRDGTGRWIPLAVGIAGVAALLGVGAVLPTTEVPVSAPVEVAGGVQLICPVPTEVEGELSVLGVPAGEVEAETLAGDPVELTDDAGALTATVDQTVVLRAEGVAAGALGGVVTRAADSGTDPGLDQVGCRAAGASAWLVGLRTGEDQQATVQLTNPDDRQAVVNLGLRDEDGLRQVPGSRDLVVPARSTLEVDLGPLLEATGTIGVQVQTTTGRVAASGRQRVFADGTVVSSESVPSTTAPQPSVLLPGVPGGDGARELVVLNPGDLRAAVEVDALGPEGAYVPAGVDGPLDVPAGGTATISLDEGFSDDPTTLRLRSDQPVTGVVLTTDGDDDPAAVPATDPLVATGAGSIGAGSGVAGEDGSLVLANPGPDPATVVVTDLTGASPQELTLLPEATLDVGGDDLGLVQVRTGAVHGAVVRRGGGTSSLPLAGDGGGSERRTPRHDPHLW